MSEANRDKKVFFVVVALLLLLLLKMEKIIFILFESRSRMCVNSNLIEKKLKYDGQGKKRGILGALTYELLIGGFH